MRLKDLRVDPRVVDDTRWACENMLELAAYAGRWVAVFEHRVVAAAKAGDEAERLALEVLGREKPVALVFIEPNGGLFLAQYARTSGHSARALSDRGARL